MGRGKKARHQKPQHNDRQGALPRTPYHGNARFLEIGSPGVMFRQLVNIDQITNLRFEEQLEEQEFPIPGTGQPQHVETDEEGNEYLAEAIPPEMQTQVVCTGYNVIVSFPGNNNQVSFNDIAPAMGLYNALLDQINGLGVPITRFPRLEPPAPASAIVGADGLPVDAAELHPDLAGGEGAGIAENDDEDFDLSEEDLDLLENPEIDEGVIEDAFDNSNDPEEPLVN
jgi:hypothetical protein